MLAEYRVWYWNMVLLMTIPGLLFFRLMRIMSFIGIGSGVSVLLEIGVPV